MKIKEFITFFKEYLEIENTEITLETEFLSISEFDSLGRMTLIALVDEHFEKKIKAQDFNNLIKIRDLVKHIGIENFEDYHD